MGYLKILTQGYGLERGSKDRGGGRERERHQLVASHTALTGDQTHNLCFCPEWGLNPKPFGVGMTLQPTEPPRQCPLGV